MRDGRLWILGSSDPEMELIERILRECGEAVTYATDSHDEPVRQKNAYEAQVEITGGKNVNVRTAYLVECDVPTPDGVERVVIDHHRPDDPGYGRPPSEFLPASSIGQVLSRLARWGLVNGVPVREYADDPEAPIPGTEYPRPGEIRAIPQQGAPFVWAIYTPFGWRYINKEIVLAAAADHCLAAAYRGQCPGVDPDVLMRWRVETLASFEGRAVENVLADIEWTRQALREAPEIVLDVTPGDHCGDGRRCDCREGSYRYGGSTAYGSGDCFCDCDGCERGDYYITARDVRDRAVPELPEAAARDGVAYIATAINDDGRREIILGGHTTPRQIRAFEEWAQSQRLVDFHVDPVRGIAGAYEIAAASA